jgi:hypothetical protein
MLYLLIDATTSAERHELVRPQHLPEVLDIAAELRGRSLVYFKI